MAVSSGPKLCKDGLILNLDVANRKSYLPSAGSQESLMNTSTWTVGTGAVTGYPINGDIAENQRLVDTDPWGNQNIVWGTYPSGNGNGDGGWNSDWVSADKTKTYRFSVWIRRTSSTTGGTFYFGLYTNGTGDTLRLSDGTSETNPYWDYRGTGGLTQNQWYLVVGHIFPCGYTGTTRHPESGYYTIQSGTTIVINNAGNIPGDVRFPNDASAVLSRVYHYYCGDSTTRLQFAYPRIDLIDGKQPTIKELLNNSPGLLRDLSPYGNHHTLGGFYIPTSNSPRKFTLDGATQGFQRASALNGVSASCTVVIYYSTTDGQELWVRGNNNNAIYLAASAGNNYYHAGVGSPSYYVDLAACARPDYPINYRNGSFHMWEAKNVDFTGWTSYDWFLYPGGWQMAGNVASILVYNRILTPAESMQNYYAFRSRFN